MTDTHQTASVFDVDILADYFQVYLQDSTSPGPGEGIWMNKAAQTLEAMCASYDRGVVLCTARNTTVKFTIGVESGEPTVNAADWDHVVEGVVWIPSGHGIVLGCSDYQPAAEFEVVPGTYRLLYCIAGLATIAADGIHGTESYRVLLWLGRERPVRVLAGATRPGQKL